MEDWLGCKKSMKKDCIYSKKERFLSEFGKTLCKPMKNNKVILVKWSEKRKCFLCTLSR